MEQVRVILHHMLEWVVLGINGATALVLGWSVMYGLICLVMIEFRRLSGLDCEIARVQLREHVGFYLLFALELLIAADVVETMLSPTLQHLGILGGVALIRIIIGYALGSELSELRKSTPSDRTEQGRDSENER